MSDGYRSEDLAARERIAQLEAELREEDARLATLLAPKIDPRRYPLLSRRDRSLGTLWQTAAVPAVVAAIATFRESGSFVQAIFVFTVVYVGIMAIAIAFRPYLRRATDEARTTAQISERARWAEQAETEADERAAAIEEQRKKRDDVRKKIDDARSLLRGG